VTIPENKCHKLELYVSENYRVFVPLVRRPWLDDLVPGWRTSLWPRPTNVPAPKILVIDVDIQKFIDKLKTKLEKVFTIDGTQTIEGFAARIILKKDAVPVFHKAYPVPFALRAMLEEKNATVGKEEKIYQVYQSDWASPIVNVKKQDSTYRTCVNFERTVNPQIDLEVYPLPIPEEAFTYLADGRVFASLDLADAYTQLKICKGSAPLLTMNTHKGLFRYTRLIYGISSVAAIFQCTMDKILSGNPNVICYIDDFLCIGKDFMSCKETLVLHR